MFKRKYCLIVSDFWFSKKKSISNTKNAEVEMNICTFFHLDTTRKKYLQSYKYPVYNKIVINSFI